MNPEPPPRATLFARNTLYLFAAHLVPRALGFLAGILLANHLGVDQFGLYSFALAFPLLFIPLYDLGIDTLIIREIASRPAPDPRLERASLGAKVILSTGMTVLLLAAIGLLPYTDLQRPFAAVGVLIVVLRTFPTTHFGIFRGHQRMGLETRSSVVSKSGEFALLVLAVIAGWSLAWILLLLLATPMLQIFYTHHLARRAGLNLRPLFDTSPVAALMRAGIPFAATGVAIQITQQIPAVLLGFTVGEESVGLYRSAQNLAFGFSAVVAAIAAALMPVIATLHQTDPGQARLFAARSLALALGIGLPVSFIGTALSPQLIDFLYASSYAPAAATLAVIVWWIPLMYATTVLGTVLGGIRRQRDFFVATALGAAANIALCLVLIPAATHNGAAIATVSAELLTLAVLLWFVRNRFGPLPIRNTLLRIIAAHLALLPVLIFGGQFHVLISLIAACLLYALGLFLSGACSRNELAILRALFSRTADPHRY